MNRRSILLTGLFVLLLTIGYLAGCATGGGQPHMQAALDQLSSARDELNAAETNKGGHRERALSLVNDAIDHVQRGMEFARTH
jgi:outer membrane murein-binding lipoprotein Lpp